MGPCVKEFVGNILVEWPGNVRGMPVLRLWQAAPLQPTPSKCNTFRRDWLQQIGVLRVRERERAKVGPAAAEGDWPRGAHRANASGGVMVRLLALGGVVVGAV
jgi:hypothetical protein